MTVKFWLQYIKKDVIKCILIFKLKKKMMIHYKTSCVFKIILIIIICHGVKNKSEKL